MEGSSNMLSTVSVTGIDQRLTKLWRLSGVGLNAATTSTRSRKSTRLCAWGADAIPSPIKPSLMLYSFASKNCHTKY